MAALAAGTGRVRAGLDLVIVVEEKRSLIEVQVREELYGTANQPVCIGKKDEGGNWLFPVKGALDLNDTLSPSASGARATTPTTTCGARRAAEARPGGAALVERRRDPHAALLFGLPAQHVDASARGHARLRGHRPLPYMAQWMDRATDGFTQMGGEGANWIGESAFSKRGHVFQNLGDGTYNHSGILALRWSVAAKSNVTYKILFNDAVAMTGGQHHEGGLTVDMIARQVRAEESSASPS